MNSVVSLRKVGVRTNNKLAHFLFRSGSGIAPTWCERKDVQPHLAGLKEAFRAEQMQD